jgi:hypothetical protein
MFHSGKILSIFVLGLMTDGGGLFAKIILLNGGSVTLKERNALILFKRE